MGLNLRPYQVETLDALRKGFLEGNKSQILYAPTGAGKTEMAIALLEATRAKGNRAAMLLDRIVLCDQTSQRLEKYDIDHGVLQSGHWRYRPDELIQVCSAQTLEKRGQFPGLNLLIVDECFTGDTLVDTPTGPKEINLLRCGDIVYNSTGVGEVLNVMVKPATELYKLEFEDGTSINCTGNHPFFTDRGWIKASEMEIGRVSFSKEGLRLLWERVCAQKDHKEWSSIYECESREMGEAYRLLNILLKEVGQPDEQPSNKIKNEGSIEGDQAQANQEGWEWTIAASASACFTSCSWGGVGGGISNSDKDEASKDWLSNLLQTGYCQLGDEVWDRIGWWFSRLSGTESARFKEDRISCFPRLVTISHIKREGVTPVFNLHISGHPSYFANGKLVHNCHQTRQQTIQFIKDNPEVRVIGLTATPFTKGLAHTYSNVVSIVTTQQLVNQEVLVPLRVFIAKEIDMKGAKKIAGEWSQAEVTKRGKVITGDIVNEWIKKTHEIYGGPRKTIVFCSGVAHGTDLARSFAEQGYNFINISYQDEDQFKKDVIEDFSKPDTAIHGLIATDILTKGFDVPDVMIGVSARPFSKSLSSHIQQMGRVMRSYPDKKFALWLDHSGNYLRFREDWEDVYANGVHELNDGAEKTKPEPSEKEKTDAKCPKCEAYFPKYLDACLNCGHVRERKSVVESVPGEMEEIATSMTREDKQLWWSMLQYYVQYSGWKVGRAANVYKEKFGVWPRGLDDTVVIPNAEIKKFIDDGIKRYIRQIKRMR